ncbi:transmembrane protein 33-like [Ptychodera flava]|uniref:transmembrane protein 33-like n=1 Tax=Ptychodera flava TaxID=63121 RepID=UPI00396A1968
MPIIEEMTEDEPTGGGASSEGTSGSDRSNDTSTTGGPSGSSSTSQRHGTQAVCDHITAHKIDTALWLSRMFTVMCCIFFIIPIFGPSFTSSAYQRALICNGLTSALRLHQRLPRFQLNREFFGRMLLEDSCHYILYSLLFINSYPITLVLTPVLLYALLHACGYTKLLLNLHGETSLQFLRRLIDKLTTNQQQLFRFIALNEIIIMPCLIVMIFIGKCSLLLPFVYYRFLSLRYSSRRNPYCRVMFYEMRVVSENYSRQANCPGFLRSFITRGIAFLEKLAPPTQPSQS